MNRPVEFETDYDDLDLKDWDANDLPWICQRYGYTSNGLTDIVEDAISEATVGLGQEMWEAILDKDDAQLGRLLRQKAHGHILYGITDALEYGDYYYDEQDVSKRLFQ